MSGIPDVLELPAIQRIGWTLLHFLWQGAAIAWLAAVGLAFMRRHSAAARYLFCCCTLAAMGIAPAVTYFITKVPALQPEATTAVQTAASALPVANPPAAIEAVDVAAVADRAIPLSGAAGVSAAHPTSPTSPSPLHRMMTRLSGYLPWLTIAWMAGVLLLSLRLAGGWLLTYRLRRAGSPPPADLLCTFRTLLDRAGIRRPVHLLVCPLAASPAMVGAFRPVILMPVSLLTGLTPMQLRAILAHELAHVRRHDYLVNLLQCVVETLLFYHPAVWWISSQMRREREVACDDLAVQWSGQRLNLAQALAAVEELRGVTAPLVLAANDGALLERIRRLLGQPPRREGAGIWPLLLVLALLATAVLGMRGTLRAADPAPSQPPATASAIAPLTRPDAAADLPSRLRERDRLLEAADKKFRGEILALAEQFPQLRKAAVGSSAAKSLGDALAGESDAGTIAIQLNWPPRTKLGPAFEVPEAERYDITIQLHEPRADVAAADLTSLYPKLSIVGRVGMAIGDVKLAKAVQALMKEALAPLEALDRQVAALEPKKDEAAPGWSKTVRGLRFKVEPTKAHFTIGEPIEVIWTFKNVTGKPMFLLSVAAEFADYFHQYTFLDTKGQPIASTSPAHSFDSAKQFLQNLPQGQTIERRALLNEWKLAGLGHPYTPIGNEQRVFYIQPTYMTRVGNDVKDPDVWKGEMDGERVSITIWPNQHPLASLSNDGESGEQAIAAAKALGEKQAAADLRAGKAVILHYGKPWSQGKPLVDDTTGLSVEVLSGCAVTPKFAAAVDAYNAAVRGEKAKHPQQVPPSPPKEQQNDVEVPLMEAWGKVEEIDHPLLAGIKSGGFEASHDKQGARHLNTSFTRNAVWKPKAAGPTADDPAKPFIWIQVSLWRKDVPSQPPPAARPYKHDPNYTYLVIVKSSDAELQKRIEALLAE